MFYKKKIILSLSILLSKLFKIKNNTYIKMTTFNPLVIKKFEEEHNNPNKQIVTPDELEYETDDINLDLNPNPNPGPNPDPNLKIVLDELNTTVSDEFEDIKITFSNKKDTNPNLDNKLFELVNKIKKKGYNIYLILGFVIIFFLFITILLTYI
jgi:hypothetical protein